MKNSELLEQVLSLETEIELLNNQVESQRTLIEEMMEQLQFLESDMLQVHFQERMKQLGI